MSKQRGVELKCRDTEVNFFRKTSIWTGPKLCRDNEVSRQRDVEIARYNCMLISCSQMFNVLILASVERSKRKRKKRSDLGMFIHRIQTSSDKQFSVRKALISKPHYGRVFSKHQRNFHFNLFVYSSCYRKTWQSAVPVPSSPT